MAEGSETGSAAYTYRPYESGDAAAIVALHNEVWDDGRTREWFRWKYQDNPSVDHVPVFVAIHDGDLVGALGFVPCPMRSASGTGLGVLGGDLVVAEAHRRKGIFSSLHRHAITRFADRDVPAEQRPDFTFAYANSLSHPGTRKLGSIDIEPRRSYFRIQRPRYYVRGLLGSTGARILGPVLDTGARFVLGRRDRWASDYPDVTVRRHTTIPAAELASLATAAWPSGICPRLDEAFYEWRFTGPRWTPDATYVASRDGRPIAATITRTTREAETGADTVSLLHTVPFGETPDRVDGVAAILDRIAADSPTAAFVRVWNPVFPDRLLRARGFLADDRRPLSWVRDSDLHLVAFEIPDGRFSAAELRSSGPALWSLDK